ncbi:MAG TPA: hypothetical protein DCW60_03300, partial [Sutterella sp.]|nr:hypothetical protein [Sutterella sp.]
MRQRLRNRYAKLSLSFFYPSKATPKMISLACLVRIISNVVLLFCAIVALSMPACASQDLPEDIEAAELFGGWEARLVVLSETRALARLSAVDELWEHVLMIDIDSDKRFWIYAFTMLTPSEITAWGARSDKVETVLSVNADQGFPGYWVRKIDGKSLLSTLQAELGSQFFDSLTNGKRLTVQTRVNGKTFTDRYPLAGFDRAYRRVIQRLEAFMKDKAPIEQPS